MAHVSRSVAVGASPDEVWAVIGGFQDLAKWHPAIATCAPEEIDGIEHRRLTLEGGGDILERNLGLDGMSVGYAILESPLAMSDYRSTISVAEAGGTAVITWASTFETADDAVPGVVAGVYEAGLGALAARFGS